MLAGEDFSDLVVFFMLMIGRYTGEHSKTLGNQLQGPALTPEKRGIIAQMNTLPGLLILVTS